MYLPLVNALIARITLCIIYRAYRESETSDNCIRNAITFQYYVRSFVHPICDIHNNITYNVNTTLQRGNPFNNNRQHSFCKSTAVKKKI